MPDMDVHSELIICMGSNGVQFDHQEEVAPPLLEGNAPLNLLGQVHEALDGLPGLNLWVGPVIRPLCIMLLYQYLLHYGMLLHIIPQYLWLFSLILQGLP